MYKKESANTHIKTFGSPGFSSLTLSYYKIYLTFKFNPYIGLDDMGFDKYCTEKDKFRSTSIDYTGAANLSPIIRSILDGPDSKKEVTIPLQCGSSATLNFEYKTEQDGHMGAYLVISKDNVTIPFKFSTYQQQIYKNGQWVTMVVQVDLAAFSKILDKYIAAIDAYKAPNGGFGNQQAPYDAAWNDARY